MMMPKLHSLQTFFGNDIAFYGAPREVEVNTSKKPEEEISALIGEITGWRPNREFVLKSEERAGAKRN